MEAPHQRPLRQSSSENQQRTVAKNGTA